MNSYTTYISQSGTKYNLDNEGFMLRNGKRDWFEDGSEAVYAGIIEKERKDFWGGVRVHDVRLIDFENIRSFIKDGVYILGIGPKLLGELKEKYKADTLGGLYEILHREDPIQTFPHSARTTLIKNYIDK